MHLQMNQQKKEPKKDGSANTDGVRLLAAAVFLSPLRLTEPSGHRWHKAAKMAVWSPV